MTPVASPSRQRDVLDTAPDYVPFRHRDDVRHSIPGIDYRTR